MEFKIAEKDRSFEVSDLERALEFYEKAFGFKETRREEDNGQTVVYVSGGQDMPELGLKVCEKLDNDREGGAHLTINTDNYADARTLHRDMGCLHFDNLAMCIYFISDPDMNWIEVVPEKD